MTMDRSDNRASLADLEAILTDLHAGGDDLIQAIIGVDQLLLVAAKMPAQIVCYI